jgi:amino acid adenylation domain-containing protein
VKEKRYLDKRNVEDIYKLSPMQHGLLFHTLYAPESAVYFEQVTWVDKNLNVSDLGRAWQQVLARHSILRTAFFWEGLDEPLQVVHRRVELPLEQHDWRRLAPEEQQRQLEILLKTDRQHGFVLSEAPLMRMILVRMDETAHTVVCSYHHLLLDNWSVVLVLQELLAWYEAFQQGRTLDLPRPRPFRDYVAWLRQQDMGEAETFWRHKLEGFTAPTRISIDKSPGSLPSQEEDQGKQHLSLSAELSQVVQSFARRHHITLNTLVQVAWALLLSRYSGEADVLFGVTVHGRPTELAGFENMVGLFVNTLPIREQIPTSGSVLDWLNVTQGKLTELHHYEYTPLVQIHGWSEVPRNQPLFDSLLAFEGAPGWESDSGVADRYNFFEKTNYPLTILFKASDRFQLQVTYDCRRFDDAAVTRMLGHFQTLLQGIVANPDHNVSRLPLLTDAERQQLLTMWRATAASYPQEWCIHQWIETQVERRPDAIAVTFGRESLTCEALNRRANQLAHYLQGLGVGPEKMAGIYAERSLEMVVGLLGILKAGGAYVPLDPVYPRERLAFILEDSRVPVLLTQQARLAGLPLHAARVVCLDAGWGAIAQESDENPEGGATPENLAYVIYTSGSTGKPKGTFVTHANVARLFAATQAWYHFDERDVWTLFHSYAFDFSVWELWGALCYGGRVVVVPYLVSRSPEAFYKLLGEELVTVLNQTPSAFRQLIRAEEVVGVCRNLALRLVIFGGEALELPSLRPWYERHGDRHPQLVNMYGITETTVHVTYRPLTASDLDTVTGSVIGGPIPDLQVYVLDRHQEPVPIGVPGELYVGGAGVARGYLQRPELTAERFVPHPFDGEPGGRLYRSGDLACYLSRGDVEYLGRIDHQVKIRGFRVELGEIEVVLGMHPSVRESVVLAREESPGDKRLVAYVVPAQDAAPAIADLRRWVQDKLPDYMVPAAFVLLYALPLTAHGKIDRRALPAPDQARPELKSAYVAPGTPVEEILIGIWAEVLGIEQAGIHDNFFELGGHSLLATQVVSRVRDAFQVELPLRVFFESTTVAGLAERIEMARRTERGLLAPPIAPVARDGELPLSFAQQRLWFLNQFEPDSRAYNSLAAVRLGGSLDVAVLERGINEIIRRHEALRTTFATVNDRPVQVVAPALSVPLPVVDLEALSEVQQQAEMQRLAVEEAQWPFDLAHGPLVRTTVLRLGEREHVLLVMTHHVASDGWSVGVFMGEIVTLYEAFSAGRPSPLPGLPVQYADFAVWQRQWLQGEVLEAQFAYWKGQLGGEAPVLELPTDRPRPPVQTFNGAIEPFVLPPILTKSLRALSQQEKVTLFMTLLAAFDTLLQCYTGEDDIVVGTPIANRNRREIEGLIGFFVNTLVLRTDLSGNPTFRELLGRVREVTLEAYAHQDLPFEMLVEELQPKRDLSRTPLFQVLFVLQNAPMPFRVQSDSTFSWLELDTGTSKFDLTLSMIEGEHELTGKLEYNADLFDAATIARLADHFLVLLRSIVSDPEQRVTKVPLLTAAEQQWLAGFNATQATLPQVEVNHQLFEAQAARTPDATAAVFLATAAAQAESFTYCELNRRANQLAHHLQALGVGPDVPVAICVGRSLDMVVAVLGILKAGGAYVPLDPAYPSERLAFMLDDSQSPVLLTQGQFLDNFPAFKGHVVCLDTGWQAVSCQPQTNPPHAAVADNLAYVIYTSGSTGWPKGVAMPHRPLTNLILWQAQITSLNHPPRTLQFSPLSFDASFQEMFFTWHSGGTLVLLSEEERRDAVALLDFLGKAAIEQLFLPFVALQQLAEVVDDRGAAAPAALRGVNTAGEQLLITPHIERFFARLPGCTLYNLYGPTEGHVVTAFTLTGGPGTWAALPPIGQPIANVTMHILDQQLNPAPIGVPGVLYLGGIAVVRGYLDRPDLTAEKFIPSPFGDASGARLYKTGDLARYLPDGNIGFLGRIDHQVKVRGYRIELGEIEAMLGQHPAVQGTVVLAREGAPGEKRLVAYVTPKPEEKPAVGDLRSFLGERLPEYMVPSAFVMLEAWPLTPSGKVDRRALPEPDRARPELEKTFVAPRTAVEKALADIWCQVLGLERVSIYDDFFELGGHSLMATQVFSQIRRVFQVELPMHSLFEERAVAGLAARIESATQEGQTVTVSPIVPVEREVVSSDELSDEAVYAMLSQILTEEGEEE